MDDAHLDDDRSAESAREAPNPYAAPAEAPEPEHRRRRDASAIKWVYLALAVVAFILAGLHAGEWLTEDWVRFGPPVLKLAGMLLGLIWLMVSWQSVPERLRRTRQGRLVSPGQAAGLMLVPIYNFYWLFAANIGLCEAIDRILVHFGSRTRAPMGIGIVACVVDLVANFGAAAAPWLATVSSFLWFVYMFQVDGAKAEMLECLGEASVDDLDRLAGVSKPAPSSPARPPTPVDYDARLDAELDDLDRH
jgi:hypothetical protein